MSKSLTEIMNEVYDVIKDRRDNPVSGAYSTYLFEQGEDQIYKKLVSQSAALILAAKGDDKELIRERLGDVLYHLLVLMVEEDISVRELADLMEERRKQSRA